MSFQTIVTKLLESMKHEIQQEENMNLITNDILYPIVHKVLEYLYPYCIGFTIIISTLLIAIFVILFLNVKICYFK